MATYKFILREQKKDAAGESPIWLRITQNRRPTFKTTGIKVKSNEWDEAKQRIKRSKRNSNRLNAALTKFKADAEATVIEMEVKNGSINSKAIKKELEGKGNEKFLDYALSTLKAQEAKISVGYYDRQKAVFSKLKQYLDNKDIAIREIDVTFLKDYEAYLANELENSTNTIHANFKVLRKVFNDAIREGIIDFAQSPFQIFKSKTEKTEREYLTETELSVLEHLVLPPESMMNHHRNTYVFCCYTGLRVSDTLTLRWNNYNDGIINVTTKKTKTPVTIKAATKVKEILALYEANRTSLKNFIFPFLDNTYNYNRRSLDAAISSRTAYINKDLQKLTAKAGIEKHISFHTSRHTFATRALRKGMRIEYVSKILGHSSIKTTQIYAKIVDSELIKAMDIFD